MKIFQLNKEILKKIPDYRNMLKQMEGEVIDFCKNFHDSPDYLSGWGHNYFCPKDGERLIFDLKKPHEHECKLCHKVYQNETLDNVWIYLYRNDAILTLMKLAVLYKMDKKQEFLDNYKKILLFYATNYTKFAIHAKDRVGAEELTYDVGGAGRLMPQGLNEAIAMIRIVTSMEILKEELEQDFIDVVNEKLFLEAVKILSPQLIRIHNIPCWINAAIGIIGLYTNNQSLIDLVFKGEFGINEQLKQGVTEDKFWYEGSIHYNFFLLEGVVNLLAFSKDYNQKFETEEIVKDMLKQAYLYSFDNDSLPNPNDGWPDVSLKTYEFIYCIAASIYGQDSEIGNIYKNILSGKCERVKTPLVEPYYYQNRISFEHLICLPEINVDDRTLIVKKSRCYKNSYFAMIRNENVNVFVKYGHRTPSHAHADKMNIEIMIDQKMLTRDLSNSGYAAPLCNEWHRKTLSHNTVLVDGQDQVSLEGGEILKFDENSCHTFVKNVYEGVDYQRNLDLVGMEIKDQFITNSEIVHTYDWIFHSEATLKTNLETEPASIVYNENGYEHLQDVQQIITDKNELILAWNLDGTKIVSRIEIEDKEVYMAKTYDNPVSRYRTAIILRSRGTCGEFKVNWTIG